MQYQPLSPSLKRTTSGAERINVGSNYIKCLRALMVMSILRAPIYARLWRPVHQESVY